jgi:hypothetical protein
MMTLEDIAAVRLDFAKRAERLLLTLSKHEKCQCGRTPEDYSHHIDCPIDIARRYAHAVRLLGDEPEVPTYE